MWCPWPHPWNACKELHDHMFTAEWQMLFSSQVLLNCKLTWHWLRELRTDNSPGTKVNKSDYFLGYDKEINHSKSSMKQFCAFTEHTSFEKKSSQIWCWCFLSDSCAVCYKFGSKIQDPSAVSLHAGFGGGWEFRVGHICKLRIWTLIEQLKPLNVLDLI